MRMRSTLATKFSVTILGVVVLAVLSSLVTLYFAWRVNMRLEEANGTNLPGVRAEEADANHRKEIIARIDSRIHEITWVVGISGVLTLVLGGFLLWLFFYRVLFPLRGMVADAQLYRGDRHAADKGPEEDELRMMGNHLRNLMSDVSDTRSRLERSRNQLLVAEKLASVGQACGQRRPRDPQSADGHEDVALLDPGGGPGKCRPGAKTWLSSRKKLPGWRASSGISSSFPARGRLIVSRKTSAQ